ncbi:hypothetical protein FBQ82_04790 [Anaerolineae bacterium CFX7]|nr:hypothetical protein [Anaerolineae bacterium CFX7]
MPPTARATHQRTRVTCHDSAQNCDKKRGGISRQADAAPNGERHTYQVKTFPTHRLHFTTEYSPANATPLAQPTKRAL